MSEEPLVVQFSNKIFRTISVCVAKLQCIVFIYLIYWSAKLQEK